MLVVRCGCLPTILSKNAIFPVKSLCPNWSAGAPEASEWRSHWLAVRVCNMVLRRDLWGGNTILQTRQGDCSTLSTPFSLPLLSRCEFSQGKHLPINVQCSIRFAVNGLCFVLIDFCRKHQRVPQY